METVVPVVGKIGEYLVPPFGEHIGYLISYKRKIMKVEENYKKLLMKKEAVQQSVEGAEWNQEIITREVVAWQANVGVRIEELRKFLEDDVKANTMCLNGWFPDLKLRYSLGKKAQENIGAILELLQEGEKYDRVFIRAPPLEEGSTLNGRFKNFESRKIKIKQVLGALRDDKNDMIAICGMAGVGKTELAKEIEKIVKRDQLFDKVAFAVVSQNPNLKEIQCEIAEQLGRKIDEKSLPGRANELQSRLAKSKKVLIILDDVWEPLDLRAIGIPHGGDKDNSCKILLTTRSEETCNRMETKTIIPIEVLTKDEAWNFFREIAGDCIGNSNIQEKAKKVEEECGRLPIAIATVGGAMRNNSNEYKWDAALDQLKKAIPYNIPGLDPKVYKSIEFSYNHLESVEAKSCFLLCCLFPEDYDIPIEDLVRYGDGLRLFANINKIEEARLRVHSIVQNLKRSNLLLESKKEESIKMHDVVRDVAISIASRDEYNFMVRCDVGLEEWPQEDTYEGFAAISLMLRKIKKHPQGLNCPRLQLLRLSYTKTRGDPQEDTYEGFAASSRMLRTIEKHPQGLDTVPTNLFDGMKELKVLSLESVSLEPLPPSILVLKNLRMLSLEHCYLKNVSEIGALVKLEMLSFRCSEIEVVPEEIGNLSQLKLLDLSNCYPLKRIATGVLSGLSRLEELYAEGFDYWESTRGNQGGTNNASLVEIREYSHQMMALKITLPSIGFLPQDLIFKNQNMKFWITIGRWPDYNEERYLSKGKLILEGDARDIAENWGANIASLLDKSEVLFLSIKNSKNIFNDLDRKVFPCLRKLRVCECADLEYLVDARGDEALQAPFPHLESLTLTWLTNLKEIYHCKVPGRHFSGGAIKNIRSLELHHCGSLKHVFSVAIASSLVLLQQLEIYSCENIERILSLEGREVHKKASFEMNLPKLTEMLFYGLPMLVDFCKAMDTVEEDLQSATQMPLYPDVQRSGTELISVSYDLFSANTILWIPNLEELRVWSSHKLQVLFNLEGQKVKEDYCTLSQLTYLYLSDLSALTHVWKNIPQRFQGFQNLMTISIKVCHNLTYLFSTSIAKLLVQLQKVSIEGSDLMEHIIQRDEEAREESGACPIKFPSMKEIRLHGCPALKTFGSETRSRRKKMEVKLDSRAHEPRVEALDSLRRNCPNFLGRCLESCVAAHCKRSKGSTYNLGKMPDDPVSTEVTLTTQEQSVSEETVNQVKICSLIPSNFVESLQNLEFLYVKKCDLLEVIFQPEGLHAEGSLVFDNLTTLILSSLPKLLHIWKKGPQEIRGFRNLKILNLRDCDSLKHLFSPSVAKLLMELERIYVWGCNEMNEILAKGLGDEEKGEAIVFPQVTSLSLRDLPKLECFCNEANAFEWPSLETVEIVGCYSLKMFVPKEMKTPKLQGVYTGYPRTLRPKVGDLNATIQQHVIKGKANDEGRGSNEIAAS